MLAPDCGRLKVPGAVTCWNCPLWMVGSPCRVEYSLTSAAMVGEAYASMMATDCPEPSLPPATAPAMPYAPCNWAGT